MIRSLLMSMFPQVNFETEPRSCYLRLLGYEPELLANRLSTLLGEAESDAAATQDPSHGIDASALAEKMARLSSKVRQV